MGKMRFNAQNKDQLRSILDQLWKQDIPKNGWHLTVEDGKNQRSLAQNRMLWRTVYQPIAEQISEDTGALLTKEKVHEFLKDRFSPRVIYEFLGTRKSYPKSTTKYTKQEMSNYIEKCLAWGAQHGVFFDG